MPITCCNVADFVSSRSEARRAWSCRGGGGRRREQKHSTFALTLYKHQAPIQGLPMPQVRHQAHRRKELAAAERVRGREGGAEEPEHAVDLGRRQRAAARGVAAADPRAGLARADDEAGVVTRLDVGRKRRVERRGINR